MKMHKTILTLLAVVLAVIGTTGTVVQADGPPVDDEHDPTRIPTGDIEPTGDVSFTFSAEDAEGNPLASQTVNCDVSKGGPSLVYDLHGNKKIWAAGEIDCIGPNINAVRLVIAVQRHKYLGWWKEQRKVDDGWQSGAYYYREMLAPCADGTHTYRVVVNGSVRLNSGTVRGFVVVSDHERFTCP